MATSKTLFSGGLAAAWAMVLGAWAASAEPFHAPRMAYGAPDLSGIWTNSSLTMLQRPPIFKGLTATPAEAGMMEANFRKLVGDLFAPSVDPNAAAPPVVKQAPQADWLEMDLHLARIDGQLRSSWIVEPSDGRVPFTEAGRKAQAALDAENMDGPEGRPLAERCLTAIGSPEGPPMMNAGFNSNYEIIQTRDVVAIEVEMNHDVRLVRLTNRTHPPQTVHLWMGDSVGWWEGETLVVETTNLDPRAGVDALFGGFPYGARTRIVERFTRVARDRILYAFTVEDPDYFQTPFRGEMPWRATKGPLYEYACHEGNYSLPNALRGARVQETAATTAPDTPQASK